MTQNGFSAVYVFYSFGVLRFFPAWTFSLCSFVIKFLNWLGVHQPGLRTRVCLSSGEIVINVRCHFNCLLRPWNKNPFRWRNAIFGEKTSKNQNDRKKSEIPAGIHVVSSASVLMPFSETEANSGKAHNGQKNLSLIYDHYQSQCVCVCVLNLIIKMLLQNIIYHSPQLVDSV